MFTGSIDLPPICANSSDQNLCNDDLGSVSGKFEVRG